MPFQLLDDLLPEVGEEETRSIILRNDGELPDGQYFFCEMFCNERKCDCRRVLINVMLSFRREPLAVIGWGWETPEFYANWIHDDDPELIAELIGPSLNFGSPASDYAPKLVEFAREILLQDKAYIERIKRHYDMFRARIDSERRAIRAIRRKRLDRKKKKSRRR